MVKSGLAGHLQLASGNISVTDVSCTAPGHSGLSLGPELAGEPALCGGDLGLGLLLWLKPGLGWGWNWPHRWACQLSSAALRSWPRRAYVSLLVMHVPCTVDNVLGRIFSPLSLHQCPGCVRAEIHIAGSVVGCSPRCRVTHCLCAIFTTDGRLCRRAAQPVGGALGAERHAARGPAPDEVGPGGPRARRARAAVAPQRQRRRHAQHRDRAQRRSGELLSRASTWDQPK